MLSNRRDFVREKMPKLGIIEVRGEREQIIDNIIKVVEEFYELQRAERHESTDLDSRLVVAGEDIWNRAVIHEINSTVSRASKVMGVVGKEKLSPNKKRNAVGDSDDEDCKSI